MIRCAVFSGACPHWAIRGGVPPLSIRVGRSTPFRSGHKAVVYWSRFTALLRKKSNPYRRRDRRRRSLSGCIIPTYNNSRPETSACFIIDLLELLLNLPSTVPIPISKTKPTISTKVSEHAPAACRRCQFAAECLRSQFALVAPLRSALNTRR